MITVLLGDDHKHARKAMRLILESDPTFRIVGEATDGQEVIQLTEQLQPSMILMDINMPKIGGLEATRILKRRFPQIKIIMVTVSDEITDLFEAIKMGAQGYLLKNLDPSSWLTYLHNLHHDDVPIPKEIATQILQEIQPKVKNATFDKGLTSREKEILTQVSRGLSNKEIGQTLFISEYTVKNHLKNIMQKLHLSNRVQLTRYVVEQSSNENTYSSGDK